MTMKLASLLKTKFMKRGVQISLGLLWLVDGALQLQHQMFSSAFATQVIAPAGQGQPIAIYGPINFEIHMILLHPAIFDAFFAIIQLALGVLILNKRTVKIGLLASVAWGLGVWYMGEGLSGMLSGHAMLLIGMPGAALIYAILALAVLPHKNNKGKKVDNRPAYWLPIVWAVVWVGGAVYQLLPGQNTVTDVASSISGLAGGGSPGWLSALQIHVSNIILGYSPTAVSQMNSQMNMSGGHMGEITLISNHSTGYWFILLLAIVQAVIGLLIFLPRIYRKIAVALGITLSLTFWFLGQSLGTYYSGLATDPNSGPLFIILGIAILGCSQLDFKLLKKDVLRLLQRLSDAMDSPTVKGKLK
jgi:hypothetical protein